MIVFDLRCGQGHAFEGWFASADTYADQRTRELVRCPVCDDVSIDKQLTARVITHKAPARMPASAPSAKPAPMQDAAAGLPPQVLAKLREIVRNTENVGERFAEEARKIHYEEVPARAIRGQATTDEAEALREEGIDFASLPPSITSETH